MITMVTDVSKSGVSFWGFRPLSVAPRMTPYLEGLVKEAREDYVTGKLEVFDNAEDLIASLNNKQAYADC